MTQHPLVRGRPHGESAHITNELRVARCFQIAQWEEPLQRIIGSCNEAVQTRGSIVLSLQRIEPRVVQMRWHIFAADISACPDTCPSLAEDSGERLGCGSWSGKRSPGRSPLTQVKC